MKANLIWTVFVVKKEIIRVIFRYSNVNFVLYLGPGTLSDYLSSLIGILESLIQSSDVISTYHSHIVKCLLPALIDSIQSNNSDMRVECLRIVSEMTAILFGKHSAEFGQESREMLRAAVESGLIHM